MFYMVCNSVMQRDKLLTLLKNNGIYAVFHYLSLHKSEYYKDKVPSKKLLHSDHYTECLIRLPFFYELTSEEIDIIIGQLIKLK